MDQRQAVDEDGDVVAVPVRAGVDDVLVSDLEPIVVDAFLVDEPDVLELVIVPAEDLDVVLLDTAGLVNDGVIGGGDGLPEESLPLRIAEAVVVEGFDLGAEVGNEVVLGSLFRGWF